MTTERFLVTGATGFLGRHVCAELERVGADVVAAGSSMQDLLVPGGPAALVAEVRPHVIVHLAWTTEHGAYWTDPQNLAWVASTLELVGAASRHGVRRFVATGSCAEYDWSDEQLGHGPIAESSVGPSPTTPYGRAKLATSTLLLEHAPRLGLSAAWAHLFFMYGPGEDHRRLVPAVATRLLRGERAPTTEGTQIRDFLDVRDVAAALVALARSEVEGRINIGSGDGRPLAEIVTELGRAIGRSDLLDLGAIADRPDDPAALVADVARLRDEVRFAPAIGLHQGLADAASWWGEQISRRS